VARLLLAIDVGNTQIVMGLYQGETLSHHWRLQTSIDRTADEYGILWHTLLASVHHDLNEVDGLVVASVVPALTASLLEAAQRYAGQEAVLVGPESKHQLRLAVDRPNQVGADRIADAVGALALYGGPVIVVDFGTATTYDAITAEGEYLGGAISPGIGISSEALFVKAARFPRLELRFPSKTIGKNTHDGIRSGLLWGTVAQVEGMVERISKEMGDRPKVILTGGFAELMAPYLPTMIHDRFLTLQGLRILYEREHR